MKQCNLHARSTRRRERGKRVADVNRWLLSVASLGRMFLGDAVRVCRFELDERGGLVFVDYFSGLSLRPRRGWFGRGFSSGGTLNQLCARLYQFIMHGKRLRVSWIGPAERWGYPAGDVEALRLSGVALGIFE